jgi:hypothetical protein
MKTITAKVSPNILKKVDRLFDGKPETIFAELLQNSRRAGSTRVDITIRHTDETSFFCFADDGQGIPNPFEVEKAKEAGGEAEPFLTLGGSVWSDKTEADEDPAGMGIFSLCAASTAGVEVYSQNWSASLTKESFFGQVPVVIRDEAPMRGTKMSFHLPELRGAQTILDGLILHGPLDVWINGKKSLRQDFLTGCLATKDLPDLGVRIGVREYRSYDHRRLYNFHGLSIAGSTIDRVIDGLKCDIDVLNCRHIKLVHPARNAVVASPDLDRLATECEIALYEYIKARGAHRLSFENYQEAHSLGVNLPEAQAVLDIWRPYDRAEALDFSSSEYKPVSVTGGMLVRDDDAGVNHSLWHAARKNPKALPQLLDTNSCMAGYSWYNDLPVLEDFHPVINGKKMDWDWGKGRDKDNWIVAAPLPTVQKTLAVRVKIRGQKKTVDLPTDILLPRGNCCSCWEAPNWLVAQDHGFTKERGALNDLLVAAYFDYCEDRDDWDGQLDEFKEERDTDITSKLQGEKEALECLLDDYLNSHKFTNVGRVRSIEVKIVPPSRKEIAEAKKSKVDRCYWPQPRFKSNIVCKKS